MAERKAKWQNDYIARTYDRINLTVPKGQKEIIQAHAETQGESVNGFINRAIAETIERDSGGIPSETAENGQEAVQEGGVVSSLEAAQRAAEAAGQTVPDFIRRAVETQAQRDQASLKLGINPITREKQQ